MDHLQDRGLTDRLYACIGRKQVELETMHAEYNALLGILQQVTSGAVAPDRVTVDTQARTWRVAPVPQDTSS